ncbi:hypothetical protein Tco_0413445 [Tanacetum coccineum]
MEPTPVHTLDFIGVLTEARRIIKASYTHFLTLSLLFLPLSLSLVSGHTLHLYEHISTVYHRTVVYELIYILIAYMLTLCAISMITYSTHQSFLGKPVSFLTSFKSLALSFFPIVSTAVVANALLFLILLSFLVFVVSLLMFGQTVGFVTDYNSVCFLSFSVIAGVVFFVVMMYFYVNLSLFYVASVTESKWGFEALTRSWYLVKGMRSVSLKLLLFYGVIEGLLVAIYSYYLMKYGLGNWASVFHIIYGSGFLILLMLQSSVAITVLYNYCKALHGELVIEVAEGFVCDYITFFF